MRADGEFARVFLATGLVPLGKTQMSEFGFSASAEHPRIGPVRNPWDTDYTAGASSSGSAAFVAAGVVPIAHANDGGGSIRIPAACNGLVGLKPTRGRLPLDKEAAQMPLHIVANGVVSRSVRDTAAFLREAERAHRNPKLPPIGDVTHPGKQRLRIAFCTKSIVRDASPEVRELTLKTASLLEELGHKVTEIDNPIPSRMQRRLPFLLAVSRVRDRAWRTPDVRAELRPHQAGQPHAWPRSQCRKKSVQAAAGHQAAVGITQDHRSPVGNV